MCARAIVFAALFVAHADSLQTLSSFSPALLWGREPAKAEEQKPKPSEDEENVDSLHSNAWYVASEVNLALSGDPTKPTLFQRFFGGVNHSRAVSARMKYVKQKLAAEHGAIQAVLDKRQNETVAVADAEAPKKVAFMFMLMDGSVDWPEVWDNFFQAAPADHFSIYVHRAEGNGTTSMKQKRVSRPFDDFGAIDVQWVDNDWCALMGVEAALIAEALQDPQNAQFILLSHDTVPLKAFSYVHSQLALESPDTSKFCFAERAAHSVMLQEQVWNEVTRSCFFRDFYSAVNQRTPKHHQWVVLAREHAEIVVRRASDGLERWGDTWRQAAPDVGNMAEGCSDEAVPAAALLLEIESRNASTGNVSRDLENIGVKQQCLTLVQWHNCFRGTDLQLPDGEEMTRAQEVGFLYEHSGEMLKFFKPSAYDWLNSPVKKNTNEFPHSFHNTTLSYLKTAVQHGFMFARKFPPGIRIIDEKGNVVKLSDVLPALWDIVDEAVAPQRVWSRTSFAGMPAAVRSQKAQAAALTTKSLEDAAESVK